LKYPNNQHKYSLLKAIAYFDIFNHPLKIDELANLTGISIVNSEQILKELVNSEIIFSEQQFYGIRSNITEQIAERLYKENQAQKYIQKLPAYVKIIKSFPFVRAISVSGSLSKNVMHDEGDIDYFIITAPGRLWICRTLLILFKKVFLLNSKKYFCVNYFVDEENLEIIDQNIFTALEVSYLLPVYNQELIDQFASKNKWTKNYFPNFKNQIELEVFEGNGNVKRLAESLFFGKFGDYLDYTFMKLTYKKWSKKFKHFDASKLELTMRTKRGISKHHPQDFQNKVLKEFQSRIDKLNIQ